MIFLIIMCWIFVLLLIFCFIIAFLTDKDDVLKKSILIISLLYTLILIFLVIKLTCAFSAERKIRKDLEKKQTIEYFENIPDTLVSLWKINKYTNQKELIFSITKE